MSDLSGNIVGYDPGGNEKHGFAVLQAKNGDAQTLKAQTLDDAEEVISEIEEMSNLIGFGIDTMTCWSTGESGWRPADSWLLDQYQDVKNSVVSPNGMYGSMGINGMAVLVEVRNAQSGLFVTETHPKVLYHALTGKRYNYEDDSDGMDSLINEKLNKEAQIKNDHEWDAAVSTLAVLRGLQGEWTNDLHEINSREGERLVEPCGETHYFWPEGNRHQVDL